MAKIGPILERWWGITIFFGCRELNEIFLLGKRVFSHTGKYLFIQNFNYPFSGIDLRQLFIRLPRHWLLRPEAYLLYSYRTKSSNTFFTELNHLPIDIFRRPLNKSVIVRLSPLCYKPPRIIVVCFAFKGLCNWNRKELGNFSLDLFDISKTMSQLNFWFEFSKILLYSPGFEQNLTL